MIAAASASGISVETYGWDTVFGIPVPDVNKAIVDRKSSPPSFTFQDQGFTLSARFGDWQICQGGDGKAVRMLLPMKEVVLTYTSTGKTFSFDTGHAVVEIELHYIPHTGTSGAEQAGGNPMALVANASATDPNTPVFTVIALALDPPPGDVTQAVISQGIADWGTANLAEFAHVFAVVDLNLMVDQGSWGFVTPNYTSYAYLDGATLADSTFGVLTMTGDRVAGKNLEQISPAAIPAGSVAGFLISNQRALLDVVRPAIMQTYSGLSVDNFQLNEQNELYLLPDVEIDLAPVEHNGSTYYPKLTSITIQSLGQYFTLTAYTRTEVAAGITAWCQTVHQYTIQLGTSSKGQTLNFVTLGSPSVTNGIDQSPGSVLTQLIIAIVGAVGLIVLTVVTDGAALVVGGLLIGLMLGADAITPALIKDLNTDDSPSIDLLLVNSVATITWPSSDEKVFKLDYGSMNTSLQLGGDPVFV